MEFDIKGFIIALLLGVLSGLGFANIFNLDFSSAITTAGTFMAGIGAIGTVYIAYRALHSWKEKVAYDTLKSNISDAMVLLDRIYLDSNSIRLQIVSLFKGSGGITVDDYLKSTRNVLEVISKYDFCILGVELYSNKLDINLKGIASLIENRKASVIKNRLKDVTDLAIESNKSNNVNSVQLDTLVADLYITINKEKQLITLLYRDLVNEF